MKIFEIQKSENASELHIKDENARIEEIKGDFKNENMIRLYQSSPNLFTFQIRTFKGIGDRGQGEKRNMIATVYFTESEFAQIVNFVKENFDLD